MIDLHTHTLLSDGDLLPSELVRRAEVAGYTALAITDHVDASNIEEVVPQIVKVCLELKGQTGVIVIPGCELTHTPILHIKEMVKFVRSNGIRLVLVHGETIVEPVLPGTNRAAIEAGIDILAHPGLISEGDARLASEKGVYLELTFRKGHSLTNGHVARMARELGAKLLINSDSHSPCDLLTNELIPRILKGATLDEEESAQVIKNGEALVHKKLYEFPRL